VHSDWTRRALGADVEELPRNDRGLLSNRDSRLFLRLRLMLGMTAAQDGSSASARNRNIIFFGLTNQHDGLAEVLQPIELSAARTIKSGTDRWSTCASRLGG
jgi:hypothetical protein